ncbi:PglL family O-oligosaccharyltransferase [Ramlibacter sp. PS4R-6]|uniref:PglL family O-oligosaccharyltransferase n=1 Tax=Ramlibacter sp. PS4R-6 TaxID=3133438 RepID=UPI0030ABA3BC
MAETPRPSAAALAPLAVGAFLLLPWLWPFAPGPSSAIVPWLAGATCAIAANVLTGCAFSRAALLAIAVLVPLGAWQALSPLEPAALGGALAVIGLAAGVGAWAQRESQVRTLAAAWWIAAALSTAMALLQYFALSGALAPWVSATEAGTAYANLRQRNQFASLTAIGLAVVLWQVRGGWRLAFAVPLAVWFGIGNAASASRTGLVEFLALAALAMLWPTRSRAQALVASSAIGAYAAAAVLLPWLLAVASGVTSVSLWERVTGPEACGSRSILWSNIAHLVRERPWGGWGWGELDYAHLMTLYPGARFCDILDNAHDLPLHLAVELGLPAALLVIAAAAVVLVRAQPWREAGSDRQLAWGVLAVVAMHSLLEYPLWYAPFQVALGLAIGVLWPRDSTPLAGEKLAVVVPTALAVLVGYAAWDYLRVSQIYLAPEDRLAAYREDPLPHIRASWLFREYASFAELTITPLTRNNARWTYETSLAMLHYSPEPRVIEKAIESATMIGERDAATALLARFRIAFPKEHALWLKTQAGVVRN